ncbi:MAG: hypothetical protein WCH98_17760 [Verrucomicrobiota bacterium]
MTKLSEWLSSATLRTACLAAFMAPCGLRAESAWRWECPELAAATEAVTVEPVKFGKP